LNAEEGNMTEQSYTFHLSPEWQVEITPEAMKQNGCFPYGPLVDSEQTRILLLRAAVQSELSRSNSQIN
jgi:hypothetical protein